MVRRNTPDTAQRVLVLLEYTPLNSLLTNTPRGYIFRGMIAEIKSRSLHRSKIIQGQLRALQKMIEQEEYCMDILTQSLAIQKSLSSLNKLLVENHIKTHIPDKLASTSEKVQQEALVELMQMYELNNRRSK